MEAERKRTGVTISGLDISAPEHTSADGSCQTINNLRYSNGAWRNVHPFETTHKLRNYPGRYTILYKHPTTDDNRYIAIENALYGYRDRDDFYLGTVGPAEVGKMVYDDENMPLGTITEISNTAGIFEITYKDDAGNMSTHEIFQTLGRDSNFVICEGEIVLSNTNEYKPFRVIQELYQIDSDEPKVTISHFGKILIISDDTTKEMKYYAFDGAKYSERKGDVKASINVTFASSRLSPEVEFKVAKGYDELAAFGMAGVGITSAIVAYEKVCNPEKSEWYFQDFNEQENDWRGEFAIFVALRMEDGSILYRSAPQIINSAQPSLARQYVPDAELVKEQPLLGDDFYASVAWDNSIWDSSIGGSNVVQESDYDRYSAEYHKFRTVECDINYDADPLVHDIAIYATRLYSFLDRDKNGNFYNSVNLMTEPFYLMDVISKTADNVGRYKIRYSNLKNIEQKPLFVPTISHSDIYANRLLEYNNRLHLLSPSTKRPNLFIDNIKTNDEEFGGAELVIARWLKNGITYYSDYYPEKHTDVFSSIQDKLIVLSNNVESLFFVNNSNNGKYPMRGDVPMSYSSSLDMSYCIGLQSTYLGTPFIKYKAINCYNSDYIQDGATITIDKFTTSVDDTNRIQASTINNCFVYPYENSYRIGSNTSTIVAANAAAIEMSDAKFGEFPLYVFTNEGVFAMQSGGSTTLYSAVVPISYDETINPNTLAVNYNVLFVTERGIMALSNQNVALLSQGLNNQDDTIPEWMRTTKLLYAPQHNEIYATDAKNGIMYVYSIDGKVWSTRDMPNGRILNNGEMVIGNTLSQSIIDLRYETSTDQPVDVAIATRPIKLGSMELKRLETFIVRFEATKEETVKIKISGSTDTTQWRRLREVTVFTNRDIIIRRMPMSVKYLRFEITSTVTDDIKIMVIDMEYYLRMLHRLR